jgi:hypothetical protein
MEGAGKAMKLGSRPGKWLQKKAKMGMRGHPIGTIAFYGSDDQRASKVAVGVITEADAEASSMRRWFAAESDVRGESAILAEIVQFLREHEVRSVAMVDRIIGCPHEEGIDYPLGQECPLCPYWEGRDRWAGIK